jgi:hypothetical protein
MQVAGLAVVSVVCFTSSAAVALLTDVPVSGWWLLSVPALECTIFNLISFGSFYMIGVWRIKMKQKH